MQPSLHCGFLLAGESAPLRVDGEAAVSYPLGRAVVTGFSAPTRCSRPWRAGERSCVAGFTMTPEFLDRFGNDTDGEGLASLRALGDGGFQHVLLSRSPVLREIARSFLENPYGGNIASLFVEANALRFLVETAAMLREEERLTRQFGQWHYRRVRHARDILDGALLAPPRTLDLAREVGVNLTDLQKIFKAAFGTTIFGYVRDQRLMIARVLILEHGLGIADAGYRVGYTSAPAFTASYRRKFGLTPSADAAGRKA